jgi:hypothetical protein
MKRLVTEIKTRWYWYNYELHYDILGEGKRVPNSITRIAGFIWIAVHSVVVALICKVFGHVIENDAEITPDYGRETLYCTRCNWSKRIIYY